MNLDDDGGAFRSKLLPQFQHFRMGLDEGFQVFDEDFPHVHTALALETGDLKAVDEMGT